MELFQLKTFLEIAEAGNLTLAASRLHLSQPAASTQLKSLEDDVGYALFQRTAKGMILTPRGELLRKDAEAVLSSMDRFRDTALSLAGETALPPVLIGLNTHASVLRIEDLLASLEKEDFVPVFHFAQIRSEDFLSSLLSGTIQAGFFYGTCIHPEVEILRLATIPMKIVLPKAWAQEGDCRDAARLSGYPWIWTSKGCPFCKTATAYFERMNIVPRKILHIDDENLIGSLVEKEVGCSILAAPVAEEILKEREIVSLDIPELTVDLHFGYRKAFRRNPAFSSLLRHIRLLWDEAGA